MSDARSTDLLYGHLGEAVYDNDSDRWHFTRVPHISREQNNYIARMESNLRYRQIACSPREADPYYQAFDY